jgi:hypothetical protein
MLTRMFASVFLVAGFLGQELPATIDGYGAFGFPNLTGTEIIVLHDVPRADELRTAVCGGRSFPIRFDHRQPVTGADRDLPEQFDHLDGTVFRVLEQGAVPDDTCLLVSDALLKGAELLPVHAASSPAPCAEDEQHRFRALRERQMKACWSLASLQPQGIIGAAEYVRVGRNALASLIVAPSERDILLDFPAEYNIDGQDLWRPDDGGEFAPDGFAVPFIIRRGESYLIPVTWGGREGLSLSMFASDADAPARRVISDYWYRSPR